MSEPEQVPPPLTPARRFSWPRVGGAVLLVLLAAGTFAAIWFAPWPRPVKRQPPPSPLMKEHLASMKKAAQQKAAKDRAEREKGGEDRP